MSASRVPKAVTLGLFAAWVVHDVEELITMPGWAGRERERLAARFPTVPDWVWDRLNVSRPQATIAIALMATVFGAAAVAGERSGGRSGFYQSVLAGFGWHGAVHLAQSAAVGRYTPGVVTAPLVVVPYSLWAWRRLRRAGVLAGQGSWSGLAWFPLAVGTAQGAAALLVRARRG